MWRSRRERNGMACRRYQILNLKLSKLILTAGRVIEEIKKENKNEVVNYICRIFRFATQIFNGGYKRKMNTDKG